MTPARYVALCAALNLGETRIAEMTGYSRGAVKNWGRRNSVWPPFAAWLEQVAPEVLQVLARHPPPNRMRGEAPASAELAIAEALRSLPPPLQEPREVRQAAIAAERAARQGEVRADALDHAGARMMPLPEALQGTPRQASPAPAAPIVVPLPPEAPAGPPAMCGRCGRFYRTPTCQACEGAG
jgi:hypothetical protein